MTISLIAASMPGGRTDTEVPIATNATFSRHWYPAAAALGLGLVLSFPDGLTVSEDLVPELLRELDVLARYFSESVDASEQGVVTRVRALRDWVAEAGARGFSGLYIG